MSEVLFSRDQNNFWKQQNPVPIPYTQEYKQAQQTNEAMSWLRIGCLITTLGVNVNDLRSWQVCDVGSGNGTFIKEVGSLFKRACNYDVCGQSITKEELYSQHWDIIFLTDVLEHFTDVNDLFKIHYTYLFLSFPECPLVEDWHVLTKWRHFKPNEHIYMLRADDVRNWLYENGHIPLYQGNPQDCIRKSSDYVNITTQIYKRCK